MYRLRVLSYICSMQNNYATSTLTIKHFKISSSHKHYRYTGYIMHSWELLNRLFHVAVLFEARARVEKNREWSIKILCVSTIIASFLYGQYPGEKLQFINFLFSTYINICIFGVCGGGVQHHMELAKHIWSFTRSSEPQMSKNTT